MTGKKEPETITVLDKAMSAGVCQLVSQCMYRCGKGNVSQEMWGGIFWEGVDFVCLFIYFLEGKIFRKKNPLLGREGTVTEF